MPVVAVEGTDGSGKRTLAQALLDMARAEGLGAWSQSFPDYESGGFGELVGDYLSGRLHAPEGYDSPLLAAMMFAGDRLSHRATLVSAIDTNEVVVLDRYVGSNVAYTAARMSGVPFNEVQTWIESIEYGLFDLPRPDVTLVVSMPLETSQRLVREKGDRSYLTSQEDRYESDAHLLTAVRRNYQELSDQHGWHSIEAVTKTGELRAPSEIATEAWGIVRTVIDAVS